MDRQLVIFSFLFWSTTPSFGSDLVPRHPRLLIMDTSVVYRARVLDRIWAGIVLSDRAHVRFGADSLEFFDHSQRLTRALAYADIDSLTRTPLFLVIHTPNGCLRLNAWPKRKFQQHLVARSGAFMVRRFKAGKCRTIHPLASILHSYEYG